MEDINNKKKALTTDELEDVSGGFFLVYDSNNTAKNASFNKVNNANMQKGFQKGFQIFGRLANAFQIKQPKGPNGNGGNGGNGGR